METEVNETTDKAPVQQAAPAAEEQQSADLNIQDLAGLKSIVDVATQRGAFRANELEAVGKLYNRLEKFIQSVTKKEA